MLTNKKSLSLCGWIILCAPITCSVHATVLQNCFAAQDYHIAYDRELNTSENKAGQDVDVPEHLVGESTIMEANCSCPPTLSASSQIYELSLAGSPLSPGTSGYGVLTEKLDIDVMGYADAINAPDGEGLNGLNINQYPTPLTSMSKTIEKTKPLKALPAFAAPVLARKIPLRPNASSAGTSLVPHFI